MAGETRLLLEPGGFDPVEGVMTTAAEWCLTDEAGVQRSVVVVGEGIEDAVAFEAEGLMNDPLDHLKHLLVTRLVPSGSCTGSRPVLLSHVQRTSACRPIPQAREPQYNPSLMAGEQQQVLPFGSPLSW